MKITKLILLGLSIIIMITLAGCTYSVYKQHELSQLEKAFLATDYQIVYKLKELPESVVDMINKKVPDITNSSSQTLFRYGGISKEIVFVFLFRGGCFPQQRLLLIKMNDNQIVYIEDLIMPEPPINDVMGLKKTVQLGESAEFKKE